MEKGGLGGGSLRRLASQSVWGSRADGAAVFSRRQQELPDDEEALLWASLEKLPTYDRVRRALLVGDDGRRREVDVREIAPRERKDLLERLVKTPEEDHEKFLLRLKNRMERVGIDLPTIEVRFEHLNLEGEVFVGSRALPTLVNSVINAVEGIANSLHILPSKKRPVRILQDVSGIVKPRRMTLLLGPPSSGKTSLLLALAGKLGADVKVSGRVTYNGHGFDEFVPQRVAAYIDQYDLHIGEMTVRETLTFSARCQGVGSRHDMLTELSRREKAANIKPDPDLDVFMKTSSMEGQQADIITEYILKILGLDGVADTVVGNEMLRGISGGQKKRVTTGEMLVGPATVLFMDEISTGLDSSTTFQIVNSIRQSINILGGTAVISLLQPAPETYMLFDDIILLSEGQIVFQGPRDYVQEFFETMGFRCPQRKGVADFLQEVTSRKDQRQYWVNHGRPYRFVTTEEFVDAFWSSRVGRELADELSRPFAKIQDHPAALTTSRYGVSRKELFKSCFAREMLLMKRNSFSYIFKATQLLVSCVIASTVFLRTKMHHHSVTDGGIFMGYLFFSEMVVTYNGFAEVSMTIDKLPVFYKQRDLLFFPAWAYSLPVWILKIPITILEASIWVFISYYATGLDPNAGRFFKQYLLLLLASQMASALFRFLAALSRNLIIANTFGFFVLLVININGGFALSREYVKKWWKWGYWSSPIMYIHNAICTNEFLGENWRHVLPGSTEPLGKMVLRSRGVFTEAKWYWIGVGALVGYTLVFNILGTMALTYLDPLDKSRATSGATDLEQQGNNTTGGSIEPSLDSHGGDLPAAGRRGETRGTSNASPGLLSGRTEAAAVMSNQEDILLPFVPLSLTFHDIRYSVDMPEGMKAQGVSEDRLELLKGVSGVFRPGVLTALMGSSGAGKTTLMDVLAGRKTGGYIEGNITMSGYPKKQETFARIAGYCEQTDIHSPNITVYESTLYSAWLRLPGDVDSKTRKWFVDKVMEVVELTPLSGAMVGLPGVNGLSTEQRKRLTIAVELVANPSIIFMDEPTSGLDARAAAIVMRTVRNIVDAGKAVICTIHQPSIGIFEAFDELLLMKRGGQQIYFGPIGHHSSHLINYFESIDGVCKIKDGYNPATWMLEQTTPAQEETLGVDFHDIYKNSELFQKNEALIEELSRPPPGSKEIYFPTKYSQPYTTQCVACLWKQSLSYWRNPPYTAVRFFFTLVIALLFGSIYWDLGSRRESNQEIFNILGSMFSAVVFMGVQNSLAVQPVVAIERTVFYRERAAGMYSALCYAFGQVVIEIPYIVLQSVVYVLIVYAMIDFEWTVGKFFWYLHFMFFTLLYFTFFGMMAVGMTPNVQVASIVAIACYLMWIIFCGFMIPRPRIPVWWRWMYWASPISWTLYGLVASQYGDQHDKLETGEILSRFLRSYFGFRHGFLPVVAVMIAGFALLFAVMFGLSIKTFQFNKR